MQRILIALLCFCSFPAFATETSTRDSRLSGRRECAAGSDTRAIKQIAEDFIAGYNAGDAEKIALLYAEDAYYLTQHYREGLVSGRRNIRAYFKLGMDAGYKLDSIDLLAMDCQGGFAYTITRYESTNGGQKALGFNLVVLKKIRGKWMIVAHESAVPEATAIERLDPSGNLK